MSTQIPNADRIAGLQREALHAIATLPSRKALSKLCRLVETMLPNTTCRIGARHGESPDLAWFDSHDRTSKRAQRRHSDPIRACLDVLETGVPVYTDRAPAGGSWGEFPEPGRMVPRGYWVHPVQNHRGETIGTLTIARHDPGVPTDHERDFLLTMTQLAGIGLCRLRAETERAASEERFRSLVETTQDLIWETNERGRLTYTNPRFHEHFGVHRTTIESALDINLKSKPETQPIESSIVTPDGEVRYFETMVTPIESPHGEIDGYRGISREVTKRKRLEGDRYRLENAIQRRKRIESLGLLAGGVAHDFNNLLMGVKGSVDLIERFPDKDELPEHLGRIRAAADHAAELCRKLLRYAGRDEALRAPVALNELVEETVDVVSTVAKSCCLDLDLETSDPVVVGDAAQLRQIVLNLVMNATQSLPQGHGTVRVRTALRRVPIDEANQFLLAGKPGNYVEVTVSDDGSGIPPELIEQIFTPFFTTKKDGHGLGLATTLGTVRDHDGMLDVESEPDRGTVFTVLIPY
ncbi:MAG: ATP-binding protein [Planctomycetota bacterium]